MEVASVAAALMGAWQPVSSCMLHTTRHAARDGVNGRLARVASVVKRCGVGVKQEPMHQRDFMRVEIARRSRMMEISE